MACIRGRGRSANIANRFLGLVVPRLYVQLCPSTHTENPYRALCQHVRYAEADCDGRRHRHRRRPGHPYAAGHPDLEVLGTCCVAGNVTADQVVINTCKVLDSANAGDIPVAAGAVQPLIERAWPERAISRP